MKRCAALCWCVVTGVMLAACGGGGGGSSSRAAPPAPAEPLIDPADELEGWRVAAVDDGTADDLRDLIRFLASDHPDVDAIAIAQHGELVMDLTFRTTTDQRDAAVGNLDPRLHGQYSVSKSIAALLVGVAIAQGDVPADLTTPYLPLLPVDSVDHPGPDKSRITLLDVLAMRLGLDWNERDPPYSSSDNQLNRLLREAHDFTQALFDLPMAAPPGSRFAYTTPATTSLGAMIEHAQPLQLEDYLTTYLLQPLEIVHFASIRTPTGLPDLGRGLYLRARDLLKFGQLVLDDGVWQGRQVTPAGWIETVTTLHTDIQGSGVDGSRWRITGYGLHWWLGTMTHDGRPLDTVIARGFGDQLLVIVPTAELVVAINSSRYSEPSREGELFALIADRVLPTLASR